MSIKSRNKVSVSFSMSSMTDIVFLLLIFFIILSTLVSPYGEKVDLPTGKNQTKEQPKIAVSITADLDYSIDGTRVAKEDLERMLLKRKSDIDETSIVLRVDKKVPTGETVGFLALAKEYGFNVVIATKP